MPFVDRAEHTRRKKATAVHFVKDGKPISDAHKSRAVQDKRDSTNINFIVNKGQRNGLIRDNGLKMVVDPILTQKGGIFGDFTKIPEYSELRARISRVHDAFLSLKPEIRAKFGNDPKNLIAFLDSAQKNQSVKDEAISLGLLPKPVYSFKKLETPEGNFWLKMLDGVEVNRTKIVEKPTTPEKPAPAPGA